MPCLDDYEVYICSEADGRRMREYSIEVKDREVSCYIESKEGEALAIHWKHCNTPSQVSCLLQLFVDGIRVEKIVSKHDEEEDDEIVCDRVWVDDQASKKLVFARALTSDLEDDIKRHGGSVGSIKVTVNKVVLRETINSWTDPAHQFKLVDGQPLHEGEDIKNLGHIIGLSKELEKETCAYSSRTFYDFSAFGHGGDVKQEKCEKPDFTFNFFYRPKEVLTAMGFVRQIKRPSNFSTICEPEKKKVRSKRSNGTRRKNRTTRRSGLDDDTETGDDGHSQGPSSAIVKLIEAQQKQFDAQQTEIKKQNLELQKQRQESQNFYLEMQKQHIEMMKLVLGMKE